MGLGWGRAIQGVRSLPPALALALAGCLTVGPAPERALHLGAAWEERHDALHLVVTLRNVGEGTLDPGRLEFSGPQGGELPVVWGEAAPGPLAPGEERELEMHPHAVPRGGVGLAAEHGWGRATWPDDGAYIVCAATRCAVAER